MKGHTSNSAAVSDGMPALSSFRCSFSSAVSVTLVFVSVPSMHQKRGLGWERTLSTDTSSCSAMMDLRLLASSDMMEICCKEKEYEDL